MVILLVALIVLGPEKLPDAVRKTGRVVGELRKMSSGFQAELRDALDEPYREVKGTFDTARQTLKDTASSVKSGFDLTPDASTPVSPSQPPAADPTPSGESAASAEGPEPDPPGDAPAETPPSRPIPPGAPPLAS